MNVLSIIITQHEIIAPFSATLELYIRTHCAELFNDHLQSLAESDHVVVTRNEVETHKICLTAQRRA